jgi:hypothetical protein
MSHEPSDVPEEFTEWAKIGDIAGQSNALSAEILEELKPWIETGKVKVDTETEKYFHLLGKYPIGVNRIDWRGVRDHLVFNVLPVVRAAMTGSEHENKLSPCKGLLLDWFSSHGIDLRVPIVWIGDDSNVSLHMTVETLLESYPLLFSSPQHHYVIPVGGEWCLNYTMEGQLFFGKQENAISQGCVDLNST